MEPGSSMVGLPRDPVAPGSRSIPLPLPRPSVDDRVAAARRQPATAVDEPRHPRVLLIEGEPSMASVLTASLRRQGYDVELTAAAADALIIAERFRPDVVVLDLVLPAGDGRSVFEALRQDGAVAIVLVSPYSEVTDRIWGLEQGADDFLPHPMVPAELVARVRSVLRRTQTEDSHAPSGRFAVGSIVMDVGAHRCWVAGRAIVLTALEFRLLLHFLNHVGQVCTRASLLLDVWGYSVGHTATVAVHVRRLREKIEPDPAHPTLIITVWGVGYRLEPVMQTTETPAGPASSPANEPR